MRSALVGIGHKPEMVALATLLTLAAFLWPVCRATLGAAGLAEAPEAGLDRASILLAAQARVADDTRLAALEDAQRRSEEINRRLEDVIAKQAEALAALADADKSGAGDAAVESARVVEALTQAAQGSLSKAEAVLREVAAEQEARGHAAEAARTWQRIGALFSLRDQQRSFDAFREAARLTPADAETWWRVLQAAIALGDGASRDQAAERGLAAAIVADDLLYRIQFLGARPRVLVDSADIGAALAAADEAVQAALEAQAREPDRFELLVACYGTIDAAAGIHERFNDGDRERAAAIAQSGLDLLEDYEERHPDGVPSGVFAWAWTTLGTCQDAAGLLQEARVSLEQAVAARAALVAAEPGDPLHRARSIGTYARLGNVCLELQDFDAARRNYEASLAIAEEFATSDPSNLRHRRSVMLGNLHLGKTAYGTGNHEGARAYLSEAESLARDILGASPENAVYRNDLVQILLHRWCVETRLGADASAFAEEGLERARELAAGDQLSRPAATIVGTVETWMAEGAPPE